MPRAMRPMWRAATARHPRLHESPEPNQADHPPSRPRPGAPRTSATWSARTPQAAPHGCGHDGLPHLVDRPMAHGWPPHDLPCGPGRPPSDLSGMSPLGSLRMERPRPLPPLRLFRHQTDLGHRDLPRHPAQMDPGNSLSAPLKHGFSTPAKPLVLPPIRTVKIA